MIKSSSSHIRVHDIDNEREKEHNANSDDPDDSQNDPDDLIDTTLLGRFLCSSWHCRCRCFHLF